MKAKTLALISFIFWANCICANTNCVDSLYHEAQGLPGEDQAFSLVKNFALLPWNCAGDHRKHLAEVLSKLGSNPLNDALQKVFVGASVVTQGDLDSAVVNLHLGCEALLQQDHVHPLIKGFSLSEYAYALNKYGSYEQQIKVLIQAISLLDSAGFSSFATNLKINLSACHYHNEDFELYQKSLDEILADDSLSPYAYAHLFMNKSNAYLRQNRYQQAIIFADSALVHAQKQQQPNPRLHAELYKLSAFGYLDEKEAFDSSMKVVKQLITSPNETIYDSPHLIDFAGALTAGKKSIQALAYLHYLEKNALSAIKQEVIFSLLSQNYEHLNQAGKALEYTQKSERITDSISNVSVLNEVNVLNLTYRSAEKERKLLSMEKEKEVQQSRFLFWSTLGIVGFLLIVASLLIVMLKLRVNRLKQEQEKHSLHQQLEHQLLEESKLKQDMEHKEQLVLLEAMKLSEKNALLASTAEQLREITENGSNAKAELKKLKKSLESAIMSENSWKEFNHIFKELNPSFIRSLETHHEDLTQRETRLLCLVKLKLNISECASLLHIEPKSVKMARYRLKRKLNLPEDESLELYVRKL